MSRNFISTKNSAIKCIYVIGRQLRYFAHPCYQGPNSFPYDVGYITKIMLRRKGQLFRVFFVFACLKNFFYLFGFLKQTTIFTFPELELLYFLCWQFCAIEPYWFVHIQLPINATLFIDNHHIKAVLTKSWFQELYI